MTLQDLIVLVNIAERARQNGLIRFEEFSTVGTAITNVVTQIKTSQEKTTEPSEVVAE